MDLSEMLCFQNLTTVELFGYSVDVTEELRNEGPARR